MFRWVITHEQNPLHYIKLPFNYRLRFVLYNMYNKQTCNHLISYLIKLQWFAVWQRFYFLMHTKAVTSYMNYHNPVDFVLVFLLGVGGEGKGGVQFSQLVRFQI